LFFSVQGGETVTDLAQGSTFTEKQMASYAQVATSPLVLDEVIRELSLPMSADDLAEDVSVSTTLNTVVLEVLATNSDPAQAAAIANAVADQLKTAAGRLSPERPDGSEAVRATVLAAATVPSSASSPMLSRNVAIGLLLGTIAGVVLAIGRDVMDTKVRTEEDIRRVTDRAILGVVPFDAAAPEQPVTMRDNPLGPRSEAVRRLRTNLQFIEVVDRSNSLVITSSIPGEGKTTTFLNLAVSLADAGQRVLLIDADLRRPSVAKTLGLEGAVGLTTILLGRADLEDVVQPWQATGVDVLPAGQIPPNPSELLGSKAMKSLLASVSNKYDMVLLDSPPIMPVTDAAVLSRLAGGLLLIVGTDRVHRAQLHQTLESLERAGGTILGLVANRIARRDTAAYRYGSDYVYGGHKIRAPRPEAVSDRVDSAEVLS